MSRMTSFGSPLLLGFEELERVLDRVTKSGSDGYPPYNIEQTGEQTLRISLAVAGFSRSDLSVDVEDNQLVIRGKRPEDDGARTYLHRGIAFRQFQRSFVLADGLEVVGAQLADGLLNVDLERPRPSEVVRRIEIAGPDGESRPASGVQSATIDLSTTDNSPAAPDTDKGAS